MSMEQRNRHSQPRVSHHYVAASLLAALLASCSSGGGDVTESRRSGSKTSVIINKKDPTSMGAGTATSIDGQILTHRDAQSSARIAQIHIPSGALIVDQKVKIESSYHTDPSDLLKEFKISKNNKVKKTNVATLVTSNIDKNLDQPMTIALDLPAAGKSLLNLVYDQRNFFVVYTVRDADAKVWRRGIMPEKSMKLDDNRVLFKSQFMGRYEVFESVKPVGTSSQEKAVQKPDFKNPPVAITKISPLVVGKHGRVIMEGKYLTANTLIMVGKTQVTAKNFISSNLIEFQLPDGVTFGKHIITAIAGESTATGAIIANVGRGSYPYMEAERTQVCERTYFINRFGAATEGKRKCQLEACTQDGQVNCLTTKAYPALDTNDIDQYKMFDELMVHGKRGRMETPQQAQACKTNGQLNCRVTGRFVAVEKAKITANTVRKGVAIPGFGPSMTTLMGKYPNNAAHMPGRNSALAILTGNNLINAMGSTSSTYQYWDKSGNAMTIKAKGPLAPAAIRNDITVLGVTGSTTTQTKPACKAIGVTGCQATGNFVAVKKGVFHEGNIKANVRIGSLLGKFPSPQYPLRNPVATALTQSDFDSLIAKDEVFEYYDSVGNLYNARGSASLVPGNIKKGVKLFGVDGTLEPFDDKIFKPENIRYGLKVGTATGKIKANCRSLGKLSENNFQQAPGNKNLDPLDTLVEHTLPTENPWPQEPGVVCDESGWEDATPWAEKCAKMHQNCQFKDKATGLIWGGFDKANAFGSHAQNVTRCKNNTYGEKSGWRLPTLAELQVAYIHGLANIKKKHSGFLAFKNLRTVWSSTSPPGSTGKAYYFNPTTGGVLIDNKTTPTNGICVRQE